MKSMGQCYEILYNTYLFKTILSYKHYAYQEIIKCVGFLNNRVSHKNIHFMSY